jgi:hypothetical protein
MYDFVPGGQDVICGAGGIWNPSWMDVILQFMGIIITISMATTTAKKPATSIVFTSLFAIPIL